MKEPHGKAVANRANPKSRAGGGNIVGEALSEVRTDRGQAETMYFLACTES